MPIYIIITNHTCYKVDYIGSVKFNYDAKKSFLTKIVLAVISKFIFIQCIDQYLALAKFSRRLKFRFKLLEFAIKY